MAKRRTPDEEVAFQMQKMKDMGVTINVQLAPNDRGGSPAGIIADAAKEAGIYYGRK